MISGFFPLFATYAVVGNSLSATKSQWMGGTKQAKTYRSPRPRLPGAKRRLKQATHIKKTTVARVSYMQFGRPRCPASLDDHLVTGNNKIGSENKTKQKTVQSVHPALFSGAIVMSLSTFDRLSVCLRRFFFLLASSCKSVRWNDCGVALRTNTITPMHTNKTAAPTATTSQSSAIQTNIFPLAMGRNSGSSKKLLGDTDVCGSLTLLVVA